MKFHKLNYTSLSMNENELLGGFSFAFTHQEEFQEDPANPNICQTINNCNGVIVQKDVVKIFLSNNGGYNVLCYLTMNQLQRTIFH